MSNSQLLKITDGWVVSARRVKSPNYNHRPSKITIDSIIIHGISLPADKFGSTDIDDFFSNQLDISRDKSFKQLHDIKVSAHFLIRRNGELVQYVDVRERAWHAGKSSLEGVSDCNNFSIGIELEGTDKIPYEVAQYRQLADLVYCLQQVYPAINKQRIVGHSDIAPGRKTDPGEVFLWGLFFKLLDSLDLPDNKTVSSAVIGENTMKYTGLIKKMQTTLAEVVEYKLPIETEQGDQFIEVNPLIGKRLSITFDGDINCIACGRKTKKSFAQGYCYPCFSSLPECDSCIMSPEKCHFKQGTCRDAQWGVEHCMLDHTVYLARSSSVKVGITRGTQIPTRWMDQGAIEALPIFRVSQRYYSGLLEVIFKQHVSDRTSWQKMLKGEVVEADLTAERDQLFSSCKTEIEELMNSYQASDFEMLKNEPVVKINYPVDTYPIKVKSFNLDKLGSVEGVLMGIKGQYLILDTGVINIRKYTGYHLSFEFA
jgi:N-acetyl-anhydromuramyl-L-alanine amidase AmpD